MNDNPQSLPADSVHQAARFVQIGCIGLLLAVLVASLGMSHFFDWSLGKSVLVVLAVMGAAYLVFFGLFFAKWLYCRSIAGRILLDCGSAAQKRQRLFVGAYAGALAVLAFVAASVARQFWFRDWQAYVLIFALSCACCAVFWVIMAFSGLQVRENGFLLLASLFRWDRVESYSWQGEEQPKLVLSVRGGFSRRTTLQVPPEHRDAVDELLRFYVAGGMGPREAPVEI